MLIGYSTSCGQDWESWGMESRIEQQEEISKKSNLVDVPREIRVIAVLFALCGVYLAICGLIMLVRPGLLGMSVGAPLLFGLELAGPWMFLLMAVVGFAVAFGLMRLNNIVRHIALLSACAGIVWLVPAVSAAAVAVQPKGLFWSGLGIIVRVVIAWNLAKQEVVEAFHKAA